VRGRARSRVPPPRPNDLPTANPRQSLHRGGTGLDRLCVVIQSDDAEEHDLAFLPTDPLGPFGMVVHPLVDALRRRILSRHQVPLDQHASGQDLAIDTAPVEGDVALIVTDGHTSLLAIRSLPPKRHRSLPNFSNCRRRVNTLVVTIIDKISSGVTMLSFDKSSNDKGFVTTLSDFRRIALSMPETEELNGMGYPNFRTGRKSFATIEDKVAVIRLTPDQQATFVATAPEVFAADSSGWGRLGNTVIRLEAANEATVHVAVATAWSNVAEVGNASEIVDAAGVENANEFVDVAEVVEAGCEAEAADIGAGDTTEVDATFAKIVNAGVGNHGERSMTLTLLAVTRRENMIDLKYGGDFDDPQPFILTVPPEYVAHETAKVPPISASDLHAYILAHAAKLRATAENCKARDLTAEVLQT
jgi:hypothetical protein